MFGYQICTAQSNISSIGKTKWFDPNKSASTYCKPINIGYNYADHKATQHNKAMDIYYQYQIFMSNDNQNWILIVDKSKSDKDVTHDYLELTKSIEARFLKMVNIHNASGLFAVSDFRVFGNGLSEKPKLVTGFKVDRNKSDSRNAMIHWDIQTAVVGYNIYYGIAPDKLYNSIMVYDNNSYDFRGLDKGTSYYFAIEAFNENGIGTKTNFTISN